MVITASSGEDQVISATANAAVRTRGYRLAVRTAGSQLVNRGSIPRIPISQTAMPWNHDTGSGALLSVVVGLASRRRSLSGRPRLRL